MQVAVAVAGALSAAAGWWWVASGHSSVFRVLPAVHLVLGLLSLSLRGRELSLGTSVAGSAAAGMGSGILLYAGTLAFVAIVSRWGVFRRHVREAYAAAAREPLARRLALSLAVSVPGEELFWRGLFLPRVALAWGSGAAALVAVAAYVASNLPSRRLPIVAAAIVGGGLWTGLAWWTGGVLAPIASHIMWTGLMLVRPPGAAREMMPA
ncbi:MAG: CPBP family intramembrane metalloprotease [Actinobacteria bacterium]|nr:CPBP family intramembrane metalloprotease [Actinomycetota bacterium]